MPDTLSDLLLARINECGEGSFTILEEGELLDLFPEGTGVQGEELRAMLSALRDRRFIDLQYAEEGMYCVKPLPAGKLYFEEKQERRRDRACRRRDAFLFSLLGAFLGALLGALMAHLIPI